MNNLPFRSILLCTLAAILLAGGTSYLVRGARLAWTTANDKDMQLRLIEYSLFKQGLYPHSRVAEAGGTAKVKTNTVYPPYAFPMLHGVFFTGNLETSRAIFQLLTLVSLGVLMWYGAMEMGFASRPAALLGAAVPLAFSGNCSGLALGQFTIICLGFLALQILLLERNRPVLAGVCWAFAMLKPHIGLPFAALFLVRGQWRGLGAGGAMLLGLSAFALWWTDVAPWHFWTQGVAGHRLNFVTEASYGAGLWVGFLQIKPRLATLTGLAIVAAFGIALLVPRIREKLTIPTAAAVCSVLSIVLFYHRHYDNVLLLLLLMPLLVGAFREKNSWLCLAAIFLAATVFTPPSLLALLAKTSPAIDWIVMTAPIAALMVLLHHQFRVFRPSSSGPSSSLFPALH